MSTDTPVVLWYMYCALKGGGVVALLWRYTLKQVAVLVKTGMAIFPDEEEVGGNITKRCENGKQTLMLNY